MRNSPMRTGLLKTSAFAIATSLALSALLTDVAFAGAGGAKPAAFVSGGGVDTATCGGVATPCRTFQYTHDNIVAPGGVIYVHDDAGYGVITITHALSIINDGAGAAAIMTATSGQAAITIQAGASDAVFIKGLTLNSAPGATNTTGVSIASAGSVAIIDSTISGMDYNGVNISPTASIKVTLSNLILANNGADGVWVYPSGAANVTIAAEHLLVVNNGHTYNGNGFYVDGDGSSGTIHVMIGNSTLSFNQQVGFGGAGGRVTLTMTHCEGAGNAEGAEIYNGSSGVPTAYTYLDNRFKGNTTTDIFGFTTLSGQ